MTIRSKRPGTATALLVSLFLAVEGAWGLLNPPAFGIFRTNPLRAGAHLLFGLIGLVVLRTGQVRGFLKAVGTVLLLVGVGYFLPVIGDMIRNLLAVDRNFALVEIGLGLLALLASRAEKHTGPREPRDRTIPL